MYFSIKINILHLYSNSEKKKQKKGEVKRICSLHDLRNKNINVGKKYT